MAAQLGGSALEITSSAAAQALNVLGIGGISESSASSRIGSWLGGKLGGV